MASPLHSKASRCREDRATRQSLSQLQEDWGDFYVNNVKGRKSGFNPYSLTELEKHLKKILPLDLPLDLNTEFSNTEYVQVPLIID